MADQSSTPSESLASTADRELAWSLLDKRPEQSEIISYDPDEIAEVRRLTESDLNLISRRSGTGSALNKESQAFLDAASIVRALSRVAEERFTQGLLDDAAKTVINAIRWQRYADGLFLSGGVTLPRINSVRLWYLLAEIYIRMDERELALKTIEKAGAGNGELGNSALSELLFENGKADELAYPPEQRGDGYRKLRTKLRQLIDLRVMMIASAIVIGMLIFTTFRAQVAVKSMIDNSSLGIDYLNIAFGPTGDTRQEHSLQLASHEFARLQGKLDSWSWLTTLSAVIPPIHDQFVALDRLANLGAEISVAPAYVDGRFEDQTGSPDSVCADAERLTNAGGNLLDQLEKNRQEMLSHVSAATGGVCQLD